MQKKTIGRSEQTVVYVSCHLWPVGLLFSATLLQKAYVALKKLCCMSHGISHGQKSKCCGSSVSSVTAAASVEHWMAIFLQLLKLSVSQKLKRWWLANPRGLQSQWSRPSRKLLRKNAMRGSLTWRSSSRFFLSYLDKHLYISLHAGWCYHAFQDQKTGIDEEGGVCWMNVLYTLSVTAAGSSWSFIALAQAKIPAAFDFCLMGTFSILKEVQNRSTWKTEMK